MSKKPDDVKSDIDDKLSFEAGPAAFRERLSQVEREQISQNLQDNEQKLSSERTGLDAAAQHARLSKTSLNIPGISLEQLTNLLKDKETLQQKSGVFVKQTAKNPDQTTTFEVIHFDTKTLKEEGKQAQERALAELQSKVNEGQKQQKEANRKLSEAKSSYDALLKDWQTEKDRLAQEIKDHDSKSKAAEAKNAADKAKFDKDLEAWQKKKKELDAKPVIGKIKINPHMLKRVQKAKAFLENSKKEKPFTTLQNRVPGEHVSDVAAQAHTIKEMLVYLGHKDPGTTSGKPTLYETKIYENDKDSLLKEIAKFEKKYEEDSKYAADSLPPMPTWTPIAIAPLEQNKFPPEPNDKTLQEAQDRLRSITQTLEDAQKQLENARSSTSITSREETTNKHIGNITHKNDTVTITVNDPAETQRVFETLKGIQGQAKIKNPDYKNPAVATQMAIHSILTLGLIPTFDPPWQQPKGPNGKPICPAELQGLCHQLKESINKQGFENEVAKGEAQRAFNTFIETNGIKLDAMKFDLAVAPVLSAKPK